MTGLIILAAGESSRLGQPKQNLVFNGKTLLQHAVETGQASACGKIVVVLGANSEQIVPVSGVTLVHNAYWQEGMASSIRAAMAEIDADTSVTQVILMLCDQPFVSAALLNGLINKQIDTGNPIIACAYQNTTGVPALFERKFFAELLQLKGKEGAKKILQNHMNDVAIIPFERGDIDIDTPEDYECLRGLNN